MSIFLSDQKHKYSHYINKTLPYLAKAFGSIAEHSLIRIGDFGLHFFIATYCCSIKSLKFDKNQI